MKNKIAEKWLLELESELSLLDHVEASPIERLRHAMPMIARIIADVKQLVTDEGFTSQVEEIYFFKSIKPPFYAHQIYEVLNYHLSMQTPIGTPEMIRTFYEDELKQVLEVFRMEAFHYQYFKTNAVELDTAFFLRNASTMEILPLEVVDPPPGFFTAMDYKFAKFIAYEKLRDNLLQKLANDQLSATIKQLSPEIKSALKWTGEAINLVEVAYGIWLTGQVKNGNATITEIFELLEKTFQIKIGRPFRRWQEIAQRKMISSTKYIDQIKAEILKRIDDGNK